MLTTKMNTATASGMQVVAFANCFKCCSAIVLIGLAVFSGGPTLAQKKVVSEVANPIPGNMSRQMAEYSRPGKYHQLLANYAGNWRFKGRDYDLTTGKRRSDVDFTGTLTREPFADGRYFIVKVLADSATTMDVPNENGKKVVTKFRVLDVEGYDNVKKKFVTSSINNNLFSGLTISAGEYNPATKTITYYTDSEVAPGMKLKEKLLFVMVDNDHFNYEIYHMQGGRYQKDTEVEFSRSK